VRLAKPLVGVSHPVDEKDPAASTGSVGHPTRERRRLRTRHTFTRVASLRRPNACSPTTG
jgi:hypothetical protein